MVGIDVLEFWRKLFAFAGPGWARCSSSSSAGPQGELPAAIRYFSQALAESDLGKDMLLDIATEELSLLEVVGSIIVMLNQSAKAKISEGALAEAELLADITQVGESTHELDPLRRMAPRW
jgi:Mn-containing catalase